MKRNYVLILLFTFMLSACATSPESPFQSPPLNKTHATVQASMTEQGFFRADTPTILIQAINGHAIDGRGEAWKLKPYSSFVIPISDSFIEVEKPRDGDFGYVRFYAKKDESYTILYKQESHHRFRLTVTDSQQHQVDTRTFGRYSSPTSYANENVLLDAIASNDTKKVQRLLQAGEDPNWHDAYGPNPLALAALENNFEIIKILIASGAVVNTIEGADALRHAASNGSIEIVKALLDNGSDINLRWFKGCSALMEAAQSGHIKIVEFLLQQGAYTQFRNDKGKTALDLAKESGYPKISDLISQHKD